MRLKISEIKIRGRLREDTGKLEDLAESMARYGLLHPIVVDDHNKLVAGQRRLEAAKSLGWQMIEARRLGDLSDVERRVLELEENVRRKNLSAYERSKARKELAETARKVLQEELRAKSARKSKRKRGRPRSASDSEAAKRTGTPRRTLGVAEAHVAAADRYPFLKDSRWTQQAALECAKVLDEIGQEDVTYLLRFTSDGYGASADRLQKFFETWRDASEDMRKKLREKLDGSPQERSRAVSLMADLAPCPDPRLCWGDEIRSKALRFLKQFAPDDPLTPAVKSLLEAINKFVEVAEKHNEESIKKMKKELFA